MIQHFDPQGNIKVIDSDVALSIRENKKDIDFNSLAALQAYSQPPYGSLVR